MTIRPTSPADAAGPCPIDATAPTPPRRLTPGAVPWRGRRLSCTVAAALAECDAHYAEAQATIARLVSLDARMPPMVIDLDPWQDIGDGIAIRRERGRVVEVRLMGTGERFSDACARALLAAEKTAGVMFDPVLRGAWVSTSGDGEPAAWYMRVREQR